MRKAKPRVQKVPKPLKPSTPASAKSEGVNHSYGSIEIPEWISSSNFKNNENEKEVLDDVCKAKPHVQKVPKPLKPSTPASAKSEGVNHSYGSIEIPEWISSSNCKNNEDEKEMEKKRFLEHPVVEEPRYKIVQPSLLTMSTTFLPEHSPMSSLEHSSTPSTPSTRFSPKHSPISSSEDSRTSSPTFSPEHSPT